MYCIQRNITLYNLTLAHSPEASPLSCQRVEVRTIHSGQLKFLSSHLFLPMAIFETSANICDLDIYIRCEVRLLYILHCIQKCNTIELPKYCIEMPDVHIFKQLDFYRRQR